MKVLISLLSAGLAALLYKNYALPQIPVVGAPAPSFTLQDASGDQHALSDYLGQWVVLYFYPKDDTPGCTKEACHFRDEFSQFEAINVKVLGVSLDDAASHATFKQKYKLPFTLLSDDGEVAGKYGALMHLGVTKIAKRHTFLIDPDGRIAKAYQSVDPEQHTQQLLADLKTLTVQ